MSRARRIREKKRRQAREFAAAGVQDREAFLDALDSVEVTLPLIDGQVGTTMTLRKPQVAALAERGLVYEHGGRWFADDRDVIIDAMQETPELLICDVCSEQPVVAKHGCRDDAIALEDVTDGTWIHATVREWCACAKCDQLIVAGDYDGLVHRAAKVIARRHGVPIEVTLYASDAVLGTFWRSRTGERVAM